MKQYLDTCRSAYYSGNPIISDSQYDELERLYGDVDTVGHKISSSALPHAWKLYSLQKIYRGEAAPSSVQGLELVKTPKLDGAAISILYSTSGELVLALTRGDGVKGEDITDKVRAWDEVPNYIDTDDQHIIQVKGEVVLPRKISNARNKASGALGLDSVDEFLSRGCTFIAYGVDIKGYSFDTYTEYMTFLRVMGFKTVIDSDWDEFPQDGEVFIVKDTNKFEELGHTSKHPRGAYALKERSEGVETTLLDVTWQVGKSGKVTPVAILDPVMIEDAKVSRATLNNIGFIDSLDLKIGDKVMVERAGGIIPRIIRKA